ncbi:MAG: helix-turn-helix domain-containing protein [Aquabacterium sp.]|jgi:cytoskeleton protein RodZ|uniref:helix-turn-helix domain-containing protein n=1 Tax=Aquabacterium sp. TaxID=1872578 RepID=UPI002A35DACD|nr:helix-turn-helix domain-containing protein [Aquabacterium sp.]MDX9842384.1 helix-turn-helix domain-containing protein [Aquabacterium sp.]
MTERAPLNLVTPDAGARHAGELLRRAREAQGLTLDHLASQIKVSPLKLEALEQGRYDSLGDSNFTRALALTVCRTLRIDATEILADLPAAQLHSLNQGKSAINAPFRDHGSVPTLFDRGHRLNLRALLAPKWLVPLVLLAAAAIIYALPERLEWPAWLGELNAEVETQLASSEDDPALPPSSMQVAPDPAVPVALPEVASAVGVADPRSLALDSVVAAASTVASAAANEGGAAVATQPAAVLTSPAPSALPTPSLVAAPVKMVLTDQSWIEVVDATGAKLFSRIARAGETLELQGQAPFRLRIGNASAVQVSFKGQPVPLTDITRNNTARVELK